LLVGSKSAGPAIAATNTLKYAKPDDCRVILQHQGGFMCKARGDQILMLDMGFVQATDSSLSVRCQEEIPKSDSND
jgi:hypothetical protein